MTSPSTAPEILAGCRDTRRALRTIRRAVPRRRAASVRLTWPRRAPASEGDRPLLVVFRARMVDDPRWLARLRSLRGRLRAYLMIAAGLPCEAIAERLAKLHVRDPGRIHVAAARTEADEQRLLERLVLTLGSAGEAERILDAWWEDATFVVMNPRFRRLHVPAERIGAFARRSCEDLRAFEIDPDGLFVTWPALDAHLGWEQFAQAVDQAEYLKARQRSAAFNRRYGRAIRSLRRRRGLRQSDIPGLTPRHVGRIERGQCRATRAALTKLASAHAVSPSAYLARLAALLPDVPDQGCHGRGVCGRVFGRRAGRQS